MPGYFPAVVLMQVLCGICYFLFFLFYSTASALTQQSPQLLQQTISSLYKARLNIVQSQREHEEEKQVMETERNDFLLFLSYLDGRIYHYCEELNKNSGPDALTGLPCPVSNDGTLETSRYGAIPEVSSRTDREKVAALDSGFNASLGEFDDMLLKEQEQIALHVPSGREGSSGGGAASGTGEGKSGGGGNGQKNMDSGQSAKATDSTEGGVAQAPANTGNNSQSRLPPTRGSKDLSKSDDDIVARQLREAAEQETDPEVKARLWEEYRKYKGT
jgi:hypothetical protein